MDQEINNMLIGTVSEIRTENVIDFDHANDGTISNASDGQTKDKAANKGKKRKITNIKEKIKKDAAMTKSKNFENADTAFEYTYVTDSDSEDGNTTSNASDGQPKDKTAYKNKKQKITNVKGKNKKDSVDCDTMSNASDGQPKHKTANKNKEQKTTNVKGKNKKDSEDCDTMSNASDGQSKDKTPNKNKKQKITDIKGKNKKNAAAITSKNLKDQKIKNVMIESIEAVSELSTDDATASNTADDSVIRNASDGETEDKTVIKNKKQRITKKGKKKNDALMTKSKNLKKKENAHPPTSEMVMASIKSLRKYKGASVDDISKYMAENYGVNVKRLKLHINRFLEKSVDSDILEKVSANAAEERFKIKKADKAKKADRAKKAKQNLTSKDGKKKLKKNTAK